MQGTSACSLSIRIAVALNSAVPDFGSAASIVSRFVSTSSGKCNVMNARPARSAEEMYTGASTSPRRDDTRTRSPSTTPSASASAAESSTASGRRSGEV